MRRPWRISLAVFSLLLAAYCCFRIENAAAITKLERVAKAKRAPLALSALSEAYPPIPDDQNAAIPLLELWRRDDPDFWKAFESGATRLPRAKAEPAIFKRVATGRRSVPALFENGPLLHDVTTHVLLMETRRDWVRKAIARGRARFDVRFDDGLAAPQPHLRGIVREANEFHLECLAAIAEGRSDDAIRAIESVIGLGNLLNEEPLSLGQLIGIRCFRLAIADIGRLLTRQQPTAAELNRMEALARAIKISEAFSRAVLAERAMALEMLSNPARYYFQLSKEDDAYGQASDKTVFRLTKTLGLDAFERRLVLDFFERVDELPRLDLHRHWVQITKLNSEVTNRSVLPPNFVARAMLPGTANIAKACAHVEVLKSAAIVAIAVERHRLQNQNLPASLEDLAPRLMGELPKDPFSGMPLLFRPMNNGYVIYSVGADLKDHGGVSSLGKDPNRSRDVTFGVER